MVNRANSLLLEERENTISEKVYNAPIPYSRGYLDVVYSRRGNTVNLFHLVQPPWEHDEVQLMDGTVMAMVLPRPV